MTNISDAELDLIEEQAADYGLELYPIEGVALDAIIKRLRTSEDFIEKLEQRIAYRESEEYFKKRALRLLAIVGVLALIAFAMSGCGHGCSQTEFLTNSLCR